MSFAVKGHKYIKQPSANIRRQTVSKSCNIAGLALNSCVYNLKVSARASCEHCFLFLPVVKYGSSCTVVLTFVGKQEVGGNVGGTLHLSLFLFVLIYFIICAIVQARVKVNTPLFTEKKGKSKEIRSTKTNKQI